jgi:signal transduction histidine kinase
VVPIDYRRLVAGLEAVIACADMGAMEALVTMLCEATEADAGTFTECGRQGGRVVVAQGRVAWALGQPVPENLLRPEILSQPFSGWVRSMSFEAREALEARDLTAVLGHPVRIDEHLAGALHLFFSDLAESQWPAVSQVLRVAAALAERVYTGHVAAPVRSPAEEDDRSLFLAVAGHELRTPVTVIKGYASLLADKWESLDEPQRRSAAKVLTQRADELAVLVDRLLRSPVGDPSPAGPARPVPFDPVDALLRAVDQLPAQLHRAVRVELPDTLPPACGDPDVIAPVITELVTNAVRASGGGLEPLPSTVDLTAGADADTVFIRVLDRGIGIDPAEAERAFERFWRGGRQVRASSGRMHEPRGLGLGLYLVRRLVERQNGWVSLRSRDGGGTVAEVRLARADARPEPPGQDRG